MHEPAVDVRRLGGHRHADVNAGVHLAAEPSGRVLPQKPKRLRRDARGAPRQVHHEVEGIAQHHDVHVEKNGLEAQLQHARDRLELVARDAKVLGREKRGAVARERVALVEKGREIASFERFVGARVERYPNHVAHGRLRERHRAREVERELEVRRVHLDHEHRSRHERRRVTRRLTQLTPKHLGLIKLRENGARVALRVVLKMNRIELVAPFGVETMALAMVHVELAIRITKAPPARDTRESSRELLRFPLLWGRRRHHEQVPQRHVANVRRLGALLLEHGDGFEGRVHLERESQKVFQ